MMLLWSVADGAREWLQVCGLKMLAYVALSSLYEALSAYPNMMLLCSSSSKQQQLLE